MTTAVTSTIFDNSTDAVFRSWGSWISAQLAACGWVQTADTGQINWGTVVTPAGASASQGYEIWEMGDALQATAPVFLKIEYGSGIWGAAYSAIWLTISDGSDGAGNLTGTPTTRRQLYTYAYSATSVPHHASGDTNRFGVSLWSNNSQGITFALERTHDANGDDTGTGVMLASCYATNVSVQIYYEIGVGPATVESTLGVLMPPLNTQGFSDGQSTQFGSIFLSDGNFMNPMRGALVGGVYNVTPGSTVALTVYGDSQVHFVTAAPCANRMSFTAGYYLLLLRFE